MFREIRDGRERFTVTDKFEENSNVNNYKKIKPTTTITVDEADNFIKNIFYNRIDISKRV